MVLGFIVSSSTNGSRFIVSSSTNGSRFIVSSSTNGSRFIVLNLCVQVFSYSVMVVIVW